MKINSINQFKKGNLIFKEGDFISAIGLIVKGRVLIYNEGMKMIVNSGSFLAINDLKIGKYQNTYIAFEDTIIYAFDGSKETSLKDLLTSNKDYNGLLVASYAIKVSTLNKTYQEFHEHGTRLREFIIETYKKYKEMCKNLGHHTKAEINLDQLPIIGEKLEGNNFEYYEEYKKIPITLVKEFYSHSTTLAIRHNNDQVNIFNKLINECNTLSIQVAEIVKFIFNNSQSSLFFSVANLGLDIKSSGGYNTEIIEVIDVIIEEINKVEQFYEEQVGSTLPIDRKRMQEAYFLLLNKEVETGLDAELYLKYSITDSDDAMEEMQGTLDKILEYGGVAEELSTQVKDLVLNFINLKDKQSGDDLARKLRRDLNNTYYQVYKNVFKKAYNDTNPPRIIDMYLNYGFMDERLLTKEERLELYFLEEGKSTGPCDVYNIKSWLTLIYEGKKEPSKNDFDQDYAQMLLDEKRHGRINDDQMKKMQADNTKKLEYEIDNMFKFNNRIVSGELGVYVPIIHSGVLVRELEQVQITSEKINEAIKDIIKTDYSAFYRESLYVNEEMGIKKEQIIRPVYPDIILMPTYGNNPIMWQDITGRKRDTPGRFVFPSFTDEEIFKLMLRTIGRFRWEICRTEQGAYWNDLTYKSLTSEYSDYIQFYRKNRGLSEDNKEKLKLQIQRGRNNGREIFVMDYETWVSNESQGAIRLNKVARAIMAAYCPFAKDIREIRMKQPLFEEVMLRGEREQLKKIREIEGRHRNLQRDNIQIPQELIDTLDYYKEG